MLRIRINPRIFTLPRNLGLSGGGFSVMNYPIDFKNIIWRVIETRDSVRTGTYYICKPCFGKIKLDMDIPILKKDTVTITEG